MEAVQMGVNLSVKGVPDDLAESLRARARVNHRSLQGELMAMIEAHVGARPFQGRQLHDHVRALKLSTPRESAKMVRDDRDRR